VGLRHIRGPAAHRGVLRRGVRAGYRRTDEPTAAQLVGDRDDELFDRIRRNVNHVLHPLLPSQRTYTPTHYVTDDTPTNSHAAKLH